MWRTYLNWLFMAVLLAGLSLAYLIQGGGTLLFLLICCAAIAGYGLLILLAKPRNIRIVRTLEADRVAAGNKVNMHVHFEADIPIFLRWLRIEESAAYTQLEHKQFIFTARSRSYPYEYTIRAVHRGVYEFDSCKVVWGDVFGWFTGSCRVEAPCTLIVHPSLKAGPGHISTDFTRSWEGEVSRSRYHPTSLGTEVREYVEGDPMRYIHWKSSARSGKLQVRIPEEQRCGQVYLLLDNNIHAYMSKRADGGSQFSWDAYEAAVSTCAKLLRSSYEEGIDAHLNVFHLDTVEGEGGGENNSVLKWTVLPDAAAGEGKGYEQLDYLAGLEPAGTWTDQSRKFEIQGTGSRLYAPSFYGNLVPGSQVYIITGLSTELNKAICQHYSRQHIQVILCETSGNGPDQMNSRESAV
ncbi:DUF58 domain-containing protein [Paenibacillus shunpengii]|uniref:DUF58 domain-containing protein n=1 Tax=Paenibacillus shunpengii TaxID=2054424 RepID=A0ABW5ST04_9BACL